MAFSFVICTSAGATVGEPLATKKRSITRTLNSPTTATIALQLGDALATYLLPTAEPRLKVYRSLTPAEMRATPGETRKLLFYGTLPRKGYHASTNADTVTCTFQDPSWRFARLYALGSEVFAGVDQGDILWGLIAAQNARFSGDGDTWIRQGATTTGKTRDRSFSRTLLSQLFADMTKLIDGCDFDLEPVDGYDVGSRTMGVLNVYDLQGSDRENAVFGYAPDGISNVTDATLDYLEPTSVAQVSGTAGQTLVLGNAGTPNADGFGVLETVTADQDVSTQATVDAKAQGIIFEQGSERPVVGVTGPLPDAPQPFVDYDIGDTVRVAIKRGTFQQISSPRVMGYTVDIDQNGGVATTLVLANPPGVYVPPPSPPDSGGGIPGVPDAPVASITTPATVGVGVGGWISTAGYYHTTSPGRGLSQSAGGQTAYISQKTILGLTIGQTYTVTAWVAGDAHGSPGGSTQTFAIFVGGNGTLAGATFSADDSAHVYNSNAAVRSTFQQLSVTFTATAISEWCGWKMSGLAVISFITLTSDWGIT